MRKAFAKGPIDRNRSKRIVDSRRREAAMADLRRALEYINEKGIKRKQNDDGSYEPGEEGMPSLQRSRIPRELRLFLSLGDEVYGMLDH